MADNVLAQPQIQVLSKQLAMIDDFLLDCLLSAGHEYESEVTEFPVETGSDITDNIRPKPIVVTMEVIVSNSPIGQLATLRDSPDTSADECYAKLQQIYNARQPVTIRTSLNTFINMAMKNLSIPKTVEHGDAIMFTATFQQVQIVTNKRVQVRRAIQKTPQKSMGSLPGAAVVARFTNVASFSTENRPYVSKTLGSPILTTLPAQRAADNGGPDGLGTLDHYKVAPGSNGITIGLVTGIGKFPDGYVRNGHYYRTSLTGGTDATTSDCIKGSPSTFNTSSGTWVDGNGNGIVQQQPGTYEEWNSITSGAGTGSESG